jgi:ligand-binding sensor domain-containing protein/two-component sensor histidine kinase
MWVKLLLLAILTLCPFGALHPQTPSYYHYSTNDGLASSTVFNIIQSRDGFIWFATLNGMSRFDGKHFTTYRTNDGLSSNTITALAEGSGGELYIGNYEKGVNVLRNGRIENYCNNINGKNLAISYLMIVPSGKEEQKIYAYRSSGRINSIVEPKYGRLITHSINTFPILVNRLERFRNNEVLALTLTGLFNFRKTRLIKIKINGLPDTEMYCCAEGSDNSFFIGARGMIYRVKDNNVTRKYKITLTGNNDVCMMLADKNNNIWFSVMNKGFFLIPNGSGDIIDIGRKMGLQNTLVNNYLEDNEGNIWVSTYGKGVYCLNNLYLKNYNENDGLSSNSVYSIEKEETGKLLIGTFNGVDIYQNNRFDHIKSNSKKTLTEYIYSIKNIKNEFYISGSFGETAIRDLSYKGIKLHLFDRPSFCKTVKGFYIFGGSGNYLLIQRTLKYIHRETYQMFLFGDSNIINRINNIFEDSEQNIWVGTSLGLCKISGTSGPCNEWKKSFFPFNSVLSSRINSISQDNKKNVWFAGEKGIASYDPRSDLVITYTNINGHDLSSSTSIVSDIRNRIWIGNMKGLYLFDGRSIKYLSRRTGLPSDEVLSLYYDSIKNFLYVGTSNGISFLDVSLFDCNNPFPPKVKITSIKAGDSVYTSYNNLVFASEQHDVYIELKALNFSSPGSVKFEYKLDNEWVATDYDFLNFISLKAGIYQLQIRAKAQNTAWSEPYFLNFRIQPQFVETIWFELLIISFLAISSVFIITWRSRASNKKIRKELEIAERINDLKHQALSAMMNPHFISNSLNSVQYLVNSQRYEEANDYIAMMAKLMRKNLDTAGSGFILLSEEIYRLRLYLDLEKLRFQDNFSYELITGTDVDTGSIMIPNMIIQPFVENSLWHGIIDSGNKGLLTVSFTFDDVEIDSIVCRSLIIKVTDNGIGINEARKNKKEDHISKGIQIIEERLKLLSAKMQLPQPIMFEDLGSQDINAQGTEVIISLPLPLYKIFLPESGTSYAPTVKSVFPTLQ